MEDIIQECRNVVDEICEKYNYDDKDTDGNDSLKTVLFKASCAMLANSSKEDRELFYQMLRHTPIVVTENLTEEGLKELENQYIGDINLHIKEEEQDLGEYGEGIAPAAYVSEPIIDEKLNIIGKKSFVYIQKVSDQAKDFLETDINVSHLIHELGHAWHAEYNQYSIGEDDVLIDRVGTKVSTYSFSKNNDGTFTKRIESTDGLFIEEGLNTIAEEQAMARYKGISIEKMESVYETILGKSGYQANIIGEIQYLVERNPEGDFEKWRLYGDGECKKEIEKWIEMTTVWKNLKNNQPMTDSYNYSAKRKIMSKIDSGRIQEFFQKYKNVYFPDVSNMKPMQKLDNSLEQLYNLNDYNLSIVSLLSGEEHDEFRLQLLYEFYGLINEADDCKIKQNLSDVRLGEVNEVTCETRDGVKAIQEQEKGIGGYEVDGK